MAQRKGWTVILSLLVGAAVASAFWLHSPQFVGRLTAPAGQPLSVELKGEAGDLKKVGTQALGPRFQMVTDGKEVFLADLQDGRVWRYFHQTKEGGYAREEEGFLPLALFFAGKKYFSAAEVEPPVPPPAKPGEKKP